MLKDEVIEIMYKKKLELDKNFYYYCEFPVVLCYNLSL